jgi:hypothetical protein
LLSYAACSIAVSWSLIDTATNSTPGVTEFATIHSTVYSPRVPIGEGMCLINIDRNTA